MARCLITAGIDCPDCPKKFGVPGIEKDAIYIANKSEILAFISSVANEISDFTLETYACLYKICTLKDSGLWKEELVVGENAGAYYNQEFTARVIDPSTSVITAIEDMVAVDVVLVIKQKDGNYYILGTNGGMQLTINEKTSGAKAGDDFGDLLTFKGISLGKTNKFYNTSPAVTEATLEAKVCP